MKFLLRWTAHNSFLMAIALSLFLSPVDVSQADRRDQRNSSVSKAKSSRVKARSPQARQKKRVKRRVVRTKKGKRVRQQRQVRRRPADRRGRNVVKKNSRRVRRQVAKKGVRRQRASQRRLTVAMLKRVPIKQRMELYRALVLTMGALELSRSSSAKVSYEQRHLLLELLFPLAHAQYGIQDCFFAGYPPEPCTEEDAVFGRHVCRHNPALVQCNPNLFPTQPCVYSNKAFRSRFRTTRGYASTTACAYADTKRMTEFLNQTEAENISQGSIRQWANNNPDVGLDESTDSNRWSPNPTTDKWLSSLDGLIPEQSDENVDKRKKYYNEVGLDKIIEGVEMVQDHCGESMQSNSPSKAFEEAHCGFFHGYLHKLNPEPGFQLPDTENPQGSPIDGIKGGLPTGPPPPPPNPNCHKFSDLPGEHFCQAEVGGKYMVVRLEEIEGLSGQNGGCPTEFGSGTENVRRKAVVYASDSPDGDRYCSDNNEYAAMDYAIHSPGEINESRGTEDPRLFSRNAANRGYEATGTDRNPSDANLSNLSDPCSNACSNPALNPRNYRPGRDLQRPESWSLGRKRAWERMRNEGNLQSNVASFTYNGKKREFKKQRGKTNLCDITEFEAEHVQNDLARRSGESIRSRNFLPGVNLKSYSPTNNDSFDTTKFTEKLNERRNRNKCFDSDVVGLHEASLFLEHHRSCQAKKIRVNESKGRSKRWLGLRSGDKKISDSDNTYYFKPNDTIKLKLKAGRHSEFDYYSGDGGGLNVKLQESEDRDRRGRTWEDWLYGDGGDHEQLGGQGYQSNQATIFRGLINTESHICGPLVTTSAGEETEAGTRTGTGTGEIP